MSKFKFKRELKKVGESIAWGSIGGALLGGAFRILWISVKYTYTSMDKKRQQQVDNLADSAINRYTGQRPRPTETRKKVVVKRRTYSSNKSGSQRPRPTKIKD